MTTRPFDGQLQQRCQNALIVVYASGMLNQPLPETKIDPRILALTEDFIEGDKPLTIIDALLYCPEVRLYLHPKRSEAVVIVGIEEGVLKFWIFASNQPEAGALLVNSPQVLTEGDASNFLRLCHDFISWVEQEDSSFECRFVFLDEEYPTLRSTR